MVKKKIKKKFKDKLEDVSMDEFCALRSKMYAYRTKDSIANKLKRVKKCVLRKQILFEDYKRCLFRRKKKLFT